MNNAHPSPDIEVDPSPKINVRSPMYYLMRSRATCWYCGRSASVSALAVPPSHETWDLEWQHANAWACLFYVNQLPAGVQARLAGASRCFRLMGTEGTWNSYWANHCEHCGAWFTDHDLHCEPGGAFVPETRTAAALIKLELLDERFEAMAAGYSFESEFFACMRRS